MKKSLLKAYKKKSPEKKVLGTLPAKFQGARVVRGEGMKEVDDFLEREATDNFDATRDMFLVIEDRALQDPDDSVEVKGFLDEANAVRYAQACANGNIDQRVLRVTEQVLVVATMNEL